MRLHLNNVKFSSSAAQRLKAQIKRPVNVQRIKLRSRVRAFHAPSRGAAGSRAISQMLRQSGVDAGR
ncbi:Mobile element protein [Lonsdalea populi]|uniref:Mobile element protein n=2 Tax=Lonsdalea TaxID=1082702 RepID=A0ACD1JEK4_9GAMM|nr:Mobile element protein [Lonsdalea populi]RAT14670.1 Mobile element protein [Lonsdalea quercina]RAT17707.1 Mobile element protein [Lonsdalea quercina]RAT18645.1 Mobile element protein [Lonsdalea populi]RAT24912.1 Mobile element protein [Lonsdalea populi]